MTELEYKLMSTIGRAIDMVDDFSDDMDEFACEVDNKLDYNRAHELASDVLRINTLLADTFNKVEEENKEEWDNLQRAECKIIEKSYMDRKAL